MDEDLKAMAGLSPPPYHEAAAAAYPKVQPPPRRLRRTLSPRAVLSGGLLVLIILSCLRLLHAPGSSSTTLTASEAKALEAGLASCAARTALPTRIAPQDRTANPRWNPTTGQHGTTVLRNATLFDGAAFLPYAVDIVLSKGLVVSVTPAAVATASAAAAEAKEINLGGAHVTPGLVDMHSHHLVTTFPLLPGTEDGADVGFGPLTPFVRAVDSMKAYDVSTARIAAGGVTTSMVLPGSSNVMGGEGAVVKNAVRPGARGEFVVAEMLLEHGLAPDEPRRRYMKMACGENPKDVWGHVRMGNVYVLRAWLARAKGLMEKQDAWCEAAASGPRVQRLLAEKGGFPEELELESTVGMLRGRVAMHNHCYEPQDMEAMFRVSDEFGFRVRAFHHALDAWKVPEMLKEYDENLTIATFAEFGLFKHEAYGANLQAGKILASHGIPIAYKSDHSAEDVSAQYLVLQAAVGHSFGLAADKALQAVTSVPAKAIDMDHRVGYVRAGFDADMVVWDAHPLAIGATPRQVYIDGVATLDPAVVAASSARAVRFANTEEPVRAPAGRPAARAVLPAQERSTFCAAARVPHRGFLVTGLSKAFVDDVPALRALVQDKVFTDNDKLQLVIDDGEVVCVGTSTAGHGSCLGAADKRRDNALLHVELTNGHVTRGLTTVTKSMGTREIEFYAADTGDGEADVVSAKDAADAANIAYAKYAVTLAGGQGEAKVFARARLGGVTRAVQLAATKGGLVGGVSTGMRTGLNSTLLNGGLFRDDVAMHVVLGDMAKMNEGTVGMAVERLRVLLKAGKKAGLAEEADDVQSPWALVARGSLPLVVTAFGSHDIQQVILLKRDFPHVDIVILGGHEAPRFAHELSQARIPVLFTATRPSPESWDKRSVLPGPPLSRSPADILTEAGVSFAVLTTSLDGPLGDSRIQSLALEASWAAKYAGLSDNQALALVSSNVEEILGLEESKDIVIWEGSPLQFGTPVLAFQWQDGKLQLSSCWPNGLDE